MTGCCFDEHECQPIETATHSEFRFRFWLARTSCACAAVMLLPDFYRRREQELTTGRLWNNRRVVLYRRAEGAVN